MSPEAELESFIDKFTPEVAGLARTLFAALSARIPGAQILVYDNYNALAIGFGSTDKVGDLAMSLAVMPRWVDLYFMWGTRLNDPAGLLVGSGKQGRHIKITDAAMLDDPRVEALMTQALAIADRPIDPAQPGRLIIKSVSAKQRPRRPAA
ncbi:MAG: DUF1801 domain-containing protein [Sphingomonas sp.]|nr:DUF1801 domain-containing protein [Sphingomonas sp.]